MSLTIERRNSVSRESSWEEHSDKYVVRVNYKSLPTWFLSNMPSSLIWIQYSWYRGCMQAWHTRVPKFEYCLSGHFQQSKRHYVDSSQLLSLSLPSRKRNSSAIPYSFLAHMVHYTRKLWSGVVQARLVYTHLLCHTASLSRAWQVSRRHVLHFRWDLCFIRIGYHEAPVLKQSHLSKLKMNLTKKITPFKTWNIILV